MAALSSETVHATTIAIEGRGVVITGPSGSGKSDLALRLIDRGAVLVSDDYTILFASDGQIFASAPRTIRGKLEIRGLGIVDVSTVDRVPVSLIIALDQPVARLPLDPMARTFLGIAIPLLALSPFEASTPIKIERALARDISL